MLFFPSTRMQSIPCWEKIWLVRRPRSVAYVIIKRLRVYSTYRNNIHLILQDTTKCFVIFRNKNKTKCFLIYLNFITSITNY